MTQAGIQIVEVAGFNASVRASLVFRSEFYRHYAFPLPSSRARGHIFQISRASPLSFLVAVDHWALSLDFSKYSARPGLSGKSYLGRPGIYLSNLVRDVASVSGFCLGLNGNNLGYWPNQFAVTGGKLIFKSVPGLYEKELEDVSGPAHFLAQTEDGGFEIRTVNLVATIEGGSRNVTATSNIGFDTGLSGYPLLVRSSHMWDESRRAAWDPKLVVDVPLAYRKTREELVKIISSATLANQQWPKHAFTLAGTTAERNLMLVAIEEWEDDGGGISLPSAANLMGSLGCTDAIVLGGKGDVQAVSSQEGPIVRPHLSSHDLATSRLVHTFGMHLGSDLINRQGLIFERPIPCALVLWTKSPG